MLNYWKRCREAKAKDGSGCWRSWPRFLGRVCGWTSATKMSYVRSRGRFHFDHEKVADNLSVFQTAFKSHSMSQPRSSNGSIRQDSQRCRHCPRLLSIVIVFAHLLSFAARCPEATFNQYRKLSPVCARCYSIKFHQYGSSGTFRHSKWLQSFASQLCLKRMGSKRCDELRIAWGRGLRWNCMYPWTSWE